MINPELFKQFLALHQSNPNLPHPAENLAYELNRPISPKGKNLINNSTRLLPHTEPTGLLQDMITVQVLPSSSSGTEQGESSGTLKSDNSMVQKMKKVEITPQEDLSTTEADPEKRKDYLETVEVSSLVNKRARKKKN